MLNGTIIVIPFYSFIHGTNISCITSNCMTEIHFHKVDKIASGHLSDRNSEIHNIIGFMSLQNL